MLTLRHLNTWTRTERLDGESEREDKEVSGSCRTQGCHWISIIGSQRAAEPDGVTVPIKDLPLTVCQWGFRFHPDFTFTSKDAKQSPRQDF